MTTSRGRRRRARPRVKPTAQRPLFAYTAVFGMPGFNTATEKIFETRLHGFNRQDAMRQLRNLWRGLCWRIIKTEPLDHTG